MERKVLENSCSVWTFSVLSLTVNWYCYNLGYKIAIDHAKLLHKILRYSRTQALTALCFLARDSMLSALYAIARPSVRLSHGWISQKQLKLGSCNFHRTVASSLYFWQDKFHPEIPRDPPSGVVKQWWVAALRETIYFRSSSAFARWLTKLDILSQ